MTLLISVRPEPGGAMTMSAGRARGLEVVSFPLFEIRPVDWEIPAPKTFDALLIGSGNVLRHGSAGLHFYRGKPAYAVGAATARAAEAAGLLVAAVGHGGMEALLASLAPQHRRLLRLSGRARVALSLPPGMTMTERVVYDNVALPMPDALARLLATQALAGSVVLLHSARAAQHFAEECDRLAVARARLRLAALGPRIAAAAGAGWMSVASAQTPDDAALLALAEQLCQTPIMPNSER